MSYHASRRMGVGLMPTMMLPKITATPPKQTAPAPTVVTPKPVAAPIVVKPIYTPPTVVQAPAPPGLTASPVINRIIQAQAPTAPISTQPVALKLPGSTVPAQSYVQPSASLTQSANAAAAPIAPPSLGPTGPSGGGLDVPTVLGIIAAIGVVVAILKD
jgi:hypothetical protein